MTGIWPKQSQQKEREMKRLRRNDEGFTLIELLVVIAATSAVASVIQAVM